MLRGAWIAISKMYNEQAAQFDSTMVMGFTLLSIDPKEGSTSMSLGPKMGIESTSLSRTLVKLEKKKFIVREVNEIDKRSVIIRLTQKGLEMRDISKKYVLDFQNQVRSALTEEEMNSLLSSLTKITELTTEMYAKSNREAKLKIKTKLEEYESTY